MLSKVIIILELPLRLLQVMSRGCDETLFILEFSVIMFKSKIKIVT